MKDTLELIIKTLVDDVNSVSIDEIEGEKSIVFQVRVAKNDMGRIIGRQGKIANAIRTLMKAVASKKQKRITIEFVD